MVDVHKTLISNGFIQTDNTYILFTTFGEFILKEEQTLNSRYTCREYVLNTEKETLVGKIYTNNPESFSMTISRLLRHFYLSNISTTPIIPQNIDFKILEKV